MLKVAVAKFGEVWFGVVCTEQKIFASAFAETEEETLHYLQEKVPANQAFQMVSEDSAGVKSCLLLMKKACDENVSVDNVLSLERFPIYTQHVLRAVARIPVGYVASYGGVAEAVGGGARAVGNVMASNAFAPLVPCHRVITSSLGLGGYGGGLRVKFALLRREKRGFAQKREVMVEGGVLQVFPVEKVLERLAAKVPWRDL